MLIPLNLPLDLSFFRGGPPIPIGFDPLAPSDRRRYTTGRAGKTGGLHS